MTTLSITSKRLPTWAPWATAAAALILSTLTLTLTGRLTPVRLGLTGAAAYALALTVISALIEGARRAKDRLATIAITSAFIAALIPLVSLVWIVIQRGSARFGWVFLNTDMTGVYGAMVEGGIYHAIIGTIYVTAIAAAIAIPLGILTAIYLVEYGRGTLARAVTMLVDVMTGIPSIVAGLFAFAVFLLVFGPAYKSAVIGGVGLAVLMTPVVVRSVEEMLRLVPGELREAAYALGVPKWLTIIKVVLRTAIAGITTGIMIAIARVIGETAPLLVTVGFASGLNWNAFDGRIATLPVFVYRQYAQGGASIDRAWAGALTLIAIVMLLNLAARAVSKYFSPRS